MITLGIVGTFSMLRLFHRLPANRITHRSLSTGLISRTVRVESLAEGYNVNRVLAAIKANPAESITVAKDHLLVRFFNEDMAKNCVASGSGTSGAVMKMDDSLSPPLVCCRCSGPWETGNVSVVGDDGYTQQCPGKRRPGNTFSAWRSGVLDLRLAQEDSYSTLLGYARCVPGAFYPC